MEIPKINISKVYNTSDNDLIKEFYQPCLKWAVNYDRGVGFFTSGWIAQNAAGLSEFVSKGGHTRWIISPILSANDYELMTKNNINRETVEYFQLLVENSIEKLKDEMELNTRNAFAWMIYDNLLELRFAVPVNKLENGDFHDKFGIFYDEHGNKISFSGSINDSIKGFSNYESIKVFKSWADDMAEFVESDVNRFNVLWNNQDLNIRVFSQNEAIREKILTLRTGERPYKLKTDKWHHQQEAMEAFFKSKHGILEMATGTGKTRTALQIMKKLLERDEISNCIIIAYGNDLLEQWYKEILKHTTDEVSIFRYFGKYKEHMEFFFWGRKGILLASRDAVWLRDCLVKMKQCKGNIDIQKKTLLLFDEVHGMGSPAIRRELDSVISPYQYRLGLSATPEREFDETGNNFIEKEIGKTIYKFGLEQAIENGILCEFDYYPISYDLLEEDKRKKRSIIARYEMMRKQKIAFDEERMYRDLADINKQSEAKLPLFRNYIEDNRKILEQCLIFVATKEYGEKVQRILLDYIPEYHTYYSEDNRRNLLKFAAGELKCLITCKKLSEGIDIRSVKNIVLFSSDKGKLVTIQRIGRSLRLNEKEPDKRAAIVDFICTGSGENTNEGADQERRSWLSGLSKIRRKIL